MQLSTIMIFIVATLHVLFFILESVLWTSPKVMRIFGTAQTEAQTTKVLALNQGLYNLGAATLLLWYYTTDNLQAVMAVLLFLASMGCVGAITANWRIFLLQSVPALMAFSFLYLT